MEVDLQTVRTLEARALGETGVEVRSGFHEATLEFEGAQRGDRGVEVGAPNEDVDVAERTQGADRDRPCAPGAGP